MPHPGPDLQQAALRQRGAADQGDGRDPASARLHGRLPVDDGAGDVHHQWRRARRRQPAGPLAGRLLRQGRGSQLGSRPVHRQGDPEPRRLARVRDVEPGPPLGEGGPQAEDRGDHVPASGGLRARRGDRGPVRRSRQQPGAPLHRVDARQGPDEYQGRGPHRGLQEAPPRRSAHRRQRAAAGGEPLLQLPPLRPGTRRALQVQQEARRHRRPHGLRAAPRGRHQPAPRTDDHARGHRRDRRAADHPQQRGRPAGRHRPPRQPPHPRERRADPERLPDRAPPHGAGGPGADDDPGDRQGNPERAHQHPAGLGRDEGVLRRKPALPVHGPDEPARGAHEQAATLRAGPGRALARACRLRRPRRPPQPLRPHLPDRDAGRPEHRPHRLAGDVRPDQRLRLHRDAVPQGPPEHRVGRPGPRVVRGRRRPGRQGRRGRGPEGPAALRHRCGGAEAPEGAGIPDPPRRHRRDRLSRRGRGGGAPRRPGELRPRRGRALHGQPRAVPLPGHLPGGRAGPDRVHGRQPQAGRLGRDGPHPVPRARRREPRPDGLEHAAPGRPAAGARGADRGHGHGASRGPGLGPGAARPRGRGRDVGDRRPDPRR